MANSILIGSDYEFVAKIRRNDFPHRINDSAVVRVELRSSYDVATDWVTFSLNNGPNSDWKLGVIAESIPSTETAKLDSGSVEMRINIQGNYEDRDGNLGSSYDLTWQIKGLSAS